MLDNYQTFGILARWLKKKSYFFMICNPTDYARNLWASSLACFGKYATQYTKTVLPLSSYGEK